MSTYTHVGVPPSLLPPPCPAGFDLLGLDVGDAEGLPVAPPGAVVAPADPDAPAVPPGAPDAPGRPEAAGAAAPPGARGLSFGPGMGRTIVGGTHGTPSAW